MKEDSKLEKEAREYLYEFFSTMEKEQKLDMKNVEGLRKCLESVKQRVKDRMKDIDESLPIVEYKRLRDVERDRIVVLEEAQRLFDEEYSKFMETNPVLRQNRDMLSAQIRIMKQPLDSKEILKRIEEQAKKNVEERMNNNEEPTI